MPRLDHQRPRQRASQGIASLKVLHIIDHLGIGGAQSFLYDLVRAQQKRGRFFPAICCLTERTGLSVKLEEADVPLWHLSAGRTQLMKIGLLIPRLWRLLKQENPSVVHTHLFASGVFGRLAASFRDIPVVIHEQCNESASASWFIKQVDHFLAQRAAAILCVSQSTAEFNRIDKGVPARKIHVIPNGIDPERLAPDPSLPAEKIKRELGVPKDLLLVTGVGRFVRQKRFDVFLRIASIVWQARQDVAFLIAGDGPERAPLEAEAERMGFRGQLRFLGNRDDINLILSVTDVLLLTSDFEGFPLTLLEAMGMGRPVVATDVDGAHEVLGHTSAGMLYPAGDALRGAQAVLALLSNPELRKTIGSAARDKVLTCYEIGGTASKIEEIYERITEDIS